MTKKYDAIIIGGGLAGLTTAYYLTIAGEKVLLLEKEKILGGRTSSWNENGIEIESGFHRHIGFYKDFPKLLKEIGINLDNIILWENEAEIKISEKENIVLGIAPFYAPYTFIKDIIGNRKILSLKDKLSLLKLFMIGMTDYTINPEKLDNYSILDYAKKLKISSNIINYIITSLSTGIFFLPKEKYSAKLFFGLFYPAIFRFPKMRIGAYKAGMNNAFIKPLEKAIIKNGGEIRKDVSVKKILVKQNKIIGVKLSNEKIHCNNVVVATDINNAKKILKRFKSPEINKLQNLPTITEITVQLELTEPLMPKDRTTFTPTTLIASYTEESRSTFKESKGRASIILVSKEEFNNYSDKKIIKLVISQFQKIGLEVRDKILAYRIVRHQDKFYDFSAHNDNLRPQTETGLDGLLLAGDYTKQKWYATMEGAVLSGKKAAKKILNNSRL